MHILLLERKKNYVFYRMASLLMTSDDRHTNVPIFLLRDAILARYRPILCYGPVFVRPSVWLVAEGPCNAKSCRRTHVVMSSSPWPIATDASCGIVGPSMRPIAIRAMGEQPGGQRTGSALLF